MMQSRVLLFAMFMADIISSLNAFNDDFYVTTDDGYSFSSQPSVLLTEGPSTVLSDLPSSTPAEAPAHIPILPTIIKTSPSVIPSSAPSLIRVRVPSLEPSLNPSTKPSLNGSWSPASGPSQQPSIRHSTIPSFLPSSKPSNHSTSSPSTRPTATLCQVSNLGYYGEAMPDNNANAVFIEYKYEMSYNNNTEPESILKVIEKLIGDTIITQTSIFPECDSNRNRALHNVHNRNAIDNRGIFALSTWPNDEILKSKQCQKSQTKSRDNNICVVVGGVMTVYVKTRETISTKNEIESVINDVLSDDNVMPSRGIIASFEYLPTNGISGEDQYTDNSDDTAGTSSTVMILVISLLSCMAIVAAAVTSRKGFNNARNAYETRSTTNLGSIKAVNDPNQTGFFEDIHIVGSVYDRNAIRIYQDLGMNLTPESTLPIYDNDVAASMPKNSSFVKYDDLSRVVIPNESLLNCNESSLKVEEQNNKVESSSDIYAARQLRVASSSDNLQSFGSEYSWTSDITEV
jgi:hypothetical protein